MLYPTTPRCPKDTLIARAYKRDLMGRFTYVYMCDWYKIHFIYSYGSYSPYEPNTIVDYEVDTTSSFKRISTKDHRIIVIDSDIDTVDYFKFILSHTILSSFVDAHLSIGGYCATFDCVLIGNSCDKWEAICKEYKQIKQQLVNARSKDECNKLWDKYFMYNEHSRTKEYLDIVKTFDKSYAAYVLPDEIETLPFDTINKDSRIIPDDLIYRGKRNGLDYQQNMKKLFNGINSKIISTLDD